MQFGFCPVEVIIAYLCGLDKLFSCNMPNDKPKLQPQKICDCNFMLGYFSLFLLYNSIVEKGVDLGLPSVVINGADSKAK